MAQIDIHLSTEHGSTITVSSMLSDKCLGFETIVYLLASYEGAKPHIYAKDRVFFHGDPAAMRSLLEKCLASLDAREAAQEVLHAV